MALQLDILQLDFKELKKSLVNRLDESGRGDRGWFIITRIHANVRWIKNIVEYIYTKVGREKLILSESDYENIARLVGISSKKPSRQLKRHHLLMSEKPLRLINRVHSRHWTRGIKLTDLGAELALSVDPSNILEKSLEQIQFAKEPWTPPNRAKEYEEFDLKVYSTTKKVLTGCSGYIDRDEFDLFLSRTRSTDEIGDTIKRIKAFRSVSQDQKEGLLHEVKKRLPKPKIYQNWRDLSLHTFSLFNLGTSMVRKKEILYNTEKWIEIQGTTKKPGSTDQEKSLRIPEPSDSDELMIPPPEGSASNDGSDGESFIAKLLRSKGWEVAFYTNKRGFGFDLWARKAEKAMLVEVKSSLDELGSISLTELEFLAAKENKNKYVLALVEGLSTDNPKAHFIQDPYSKLEIKEQKMTSYTITGSEWKGYSNS